MKFWVINTFRTVVYISYFAIIAAGIYLGYYNGYVEQVSSVENMRIGFSGDTARLLTFLLISGIGWLIATVIIGLILTLLDIRDDINDRLPDARRDD